VPILRTIAAPEIAGARGGSLLDAMRRMRLALVLAAACATSPGTGELAASVVTTHDIHVHATGSIYPQTTTIDPGDQVRFIFDTWRDSVIPAIGTGPNPYPAICDQPKGWVDSDPNNFAGPMPHNVSGLFALNPGAGDLGLVEMTSVGNPCGGAEVRGHVGDRWLCASEASGAVLEETWADPDLVGVHLRFDWSDLNPADGQYTLDALLAEIDRAVANGKLFNLAIAAGKRGTPDWIFDTDVDLVARPNGGGGVPRVRVEDRGGGGGPGCGSEMDLGDPGNANYQARYTTMLAHVASTLKSNAARYRALAYIKVSGANLFTGENRLPKRCDLGCVCNTQRWSEAGYRPAGLRSFYEAVETSLAYWFPGKTMSYGLIQDGFPRVDDGGGYEDANGAYIDGNGAAVPNTLDIGAFEQTQDVIDHGQSEWGMSFAVQHNGLQPRPPACINLGDPGCPNKWVVIEGNEGQPIGFQTQNIQEIGDNALLESALDNGYANSNATFIEIYEERSWEARIEGTLDPSNPASHTVGWWANQFHGRRLGIPPVLVPLVPIAFTHTPQRYPFGPAGDQTLYFIHGAKCASHANGWGKIVIRPQAP
jgi:hypothetical protein